MVKILSILSLLLFSSFLTGCATSPSVPVSVSGQNLKSEIEISPSITPDLINFKDPDGSFDIKNGEILVGGIRIGYVKNSIIYLQVHGKTIHFPGNYQDLSFGSADFPPFNADGFSLYGITFYPQYRGPYAVYRPIDSNKISYVCDGPLVFNSDGSPRPFQYCETNGKDYLTQYEHSGAATGFSTGADYTEFWQKIYIRRINGENLIFSGYVPGQVVLTNDPTQDEIISAYDSLVAYKLMSPGKIPSKIRAGGILTGEEWNENNKVLEPLEKQIAAISRTKEYLDLILANPDAKQKIGIWDYFASSLKGD